MVRMVAMTFHFELHQLDKNGCVYADTLSICPIYFKDVDFEIYKGV